MQIGSNGVLVVRAAGNQRQDNWGLVGKLRENEIKKHKFRERHEYSLH